MRMFDLYSDLLKYPKDMNEFSVKLAELGRPRFAHMKACELGTLQEEYVDAFDFNEKSSLIITTHVASDEKDRGNILAGFAAFQKLYGKRSSGSSAPDYLPEILNAFQTATMEAESKDDVLLMAGLLMRVVDKIACSLNKSGSLYSPLMRGLAEELKLISENPEVCNA